MTDMIERVARAIFETAEAVAPASFVSPDAPDRERGVWLVTIDGRFDMLAVARAAIAAMHEPTYWIPMTAAALEPPNGPADPVWLKAGALLAEGDAMIDAAIERAEKAPNKGA